MPALDHSTTLLDPDAMGTLLRNSLPRLSGARECRIHQSRRRISRKTEEQGAPYLGVVYELRPVDAPSSSAQWCYVKAFSRGASRSAPEAQSAARIDALDALAWLLPQDPAMPHLAAFLDPSRVQAEFANCGESVELGDAGEATNRGAAGAGVASSATVTLVRHEPESHCTARFEIPGRGKRLAVYGKTYADTRWIDAARRVQALWSASENADAFAIARPLGTSRALHALWQEEVRGVALRRELHGARARTWLARVASALAQMQGGAQLDDPPLTPIELLARTTKQCRKLARADASLAAAIDPVLGALQRSMPQMTAPVAAHGDFHADQMLCTDRRVALFDFDNFVTGSPALDVADFASQLLTDADFEPRRRVELASIWVAESLARLPHSVLPAELDWHLRALLLRKAYSFFVRHRSGWRARVLEAAELAARGAALLNPARSVA